MISGRYRTEMLCRFWSDNRHGYCLAPTCHQVSGDLEHLLICCPALEHTRHRLHSLWCLKTADCLPLQALITQVLGSDPSLQVKFILDSTSNPQVIRLSQAFGPEIIDRLMYLTRTWAFTVHKHKLKLLGRWPETHRPNKSTQFKTLDYNSNAFPVTGVPAATSAVTRSARGTTLGFNPLLSITTAVHNFDQPLVTQVPSITNSVSQQANGVVDQDGGLCGGGVGDVVAVCGLDAGACEQQPVSAINLFCSSFLMAHSAGRLAGSLAWDNTL